MSAKTYLLRAALWHVVIFLCCISGKGVKAKVVGQGSDGGSPSAWFQTNVREIDVSMNVDEVLDYLEQFGSIARLISVGGILANYATNLFSHTRDPYLSQRVSGDLISDALDAAHSRGMRLLARMDFSKVQGNVAEEHPDWLLRLPRGRVAESRCRSGLDGFFVNWAGLNERGYFKAYHCVCHCESCRARWREDVGDLELPNGPEDATYPKWKEFGDEIIDDWTAQVSGFVLEKLPDAGLILGENAKIRFHEANNAVDHETWHHPTSETVSSVTSYRPDVPVLANSVSFVGMPYRMGNEEPVQFAQYLLQTISGGGNPSTYIMGPKRYDVVILPNLGKVRSEDASTLDEWVAQGGRLIATGTSGIDDDGVAQLKALPTERQRDVITERESLWSTLRPSRTYQISCTIVVLQSRSMGRNYSLFEWKEHAESRHKSLDYAPFAPPEYVYGNIQGDERGCGISTFEKGKGIAIPFTVGRGYRELGLRVFRDFYDMILREDGGAEENLNLTLPNSLR
ncbi:hypothetical protein DL768_010833 [Monosporascus sp. mg162]|nr:hypothetical protein DL768_010833 [Monosporascus sp. mg162]